MTNLANEQASGLTSAWAPTLIPKSVIEILRRPLPPEAIKPHPTKKFLSTIKAIYAVERLNEAFGLNGWKIKNELVELYETKNEETGKIRTMVVMKSFLTVPEYGIEVEAYGGNDNEDRGDAYKGACTDALTKICSYIYVGMDVYKGIKSSATVNAASAITGGSQQAADELAKEKIAAKTVIANAKKGSRHAKMIEAFWDIERRFERLTLHDIYVDHLHVAGHNFAEQFPDTPEGLASAEECFKAMARELSELEVAAKKATE